MKTLKLGIIAIGVTLLTGTAIAQTEKGKWDLSLMGSFNSAWVSSDEANTGTDSVQLFYGNLGVGYFMTDALEIKGTVGAVGGTIPEAGSFWVAPLSIGVDYHFNTKGKTVPYVGVALGVYVVGTGFAEDEGMAGAALGDAHVGLKQFVSQNVALDFRLGYQYLPLPYISLNNVTASVGLSLLF